MPVVQILRQSFLGPRGGVCVGGCVCVAIRMVRTKGMVGWCISDMPTSEKEKCGPKWDQKDVMPKRPMSSQSGMLPLPSAAREAKITLSVLFFRAKCGLAGKPTIGLVRRGGGEDGSWIVLLQHRSLSQQ